MKTFLLTDFKVQSTGTDGGHHYVLANVAHNCIEREILVHFYSKDDEAKLKDLTIISVKGKLVDQGLQQTLILREAQIVD